MDNIPKDNNQNPPSSSGEIFKDSSQSAYSAATSLPEAETGVPAPVDNLSQSEQEVSPISGTIEGGFPPDSSGDNAGPPPPYAEDSRKKYLLIGIAVVFLLLMTFFIIKLISGGNKPKPEGAVTLTYWGLWEDKSILQPVIDEYKRSHPTITVNYILQDSKQYRDRLQKAIEKGEGPDIFRFHNTWVPMFIDNLAPIPSNIYTVEDFKKIFFPVALNDLKITNEKGDIAIYGIPLEIDGLVLFYNEKILKSANVSVPTTWFDLQDITGKLTVKEKGKIVTSAIALGTAENVEHFSDILGLMLLQNGVQPAKSLFTCSTKGKNDCAVETLRFYRKFAETPNNSWDETLENSIVSFAGEKTAMIIAPSWQALTIKKMKPALNFKVAQVPQLPCQNPPCSPVNWATYWVEGVNKKGKNQAESWEFLRYLTDPSTMKKLYSAQQQSRTLFGEPYSRMELAATLKENQYLGPLINSAPTMKSFYSASRTFDGDTGLNSRINKYLKDAVNQLSQGTSNEEALKTADKGFQEVFTYYRLSASP